MAPRPRPFARQLPLIPEALLRKHRVFEPFDSRFKRCARLLQALWREAQQLPIGACSTPDGRQRRIGSLLGSAAADAGRNFLSPDVAHLVRREIAYQEPGALIERNRLYGNLLSSMPLAFNLFAPLHFDKVLAAKALRSLLPRTDIARVLHVWFEHSPGRRRPELTADRTAFDVAIIYERSDGEKGLLAVEQKYTESGGEGQGDLNPRYDELAVTSELFRNPASAFLRTSSMQQLFREHLLTFAARYRGDYAEACFLLVAPRHNHRLQRAAELYATQLSEPGPDHVPFINLELEQVIEALAWAGAYDYATLLHDRYCDWSKVDAAVEAALLTKAGNWHIQRPAASAPIGLLPRAA